MASRRTIDVGEVLADAKLGWRPIAVLLLSFLVIMLDGYDLLCMAFVAPELSKQLGMDIASFGPIFTAAFAGIMLGGLAISPFGDRFGRKGILVGSVTLFGVFSLLPIVDFSYSHLIAYRFLTGLGLGGAMPGAAALTNEYAPRRFKGLFVNFMFAGVPTGAVVGGLLASRLIPVYGWQAAFWIAGVTPLVLALLLIPFMPESVTYLAAAGRRPAYIATMLGRFDRTRSYLSTDGFIMHELTSQGGGQIGNLFREGRTAGTLLLWLIVFTTLFANASLASWLPAIMTRQGFPLSTGILGPVMMNLGGILGTMLLGLLFTRVGATFIIAGGLALTSIGTILTGYVLVGGGPALGVIFVMGMFLLGSMSSITTLITAFYPTKLRATGVGWALGIGRIGAAIGPVLGGVLIGGGFRAPSIFIAIGLATSVGVVASLVMGALYVAHRRSPALAAESLFRDGPIVRTSKADSALLHPGSRISAD